MKLICLLLLSLSNLYGIAQQSTGIKFEKQLSWTEIKQKAKKENKFIFLDAYTTWCIPCRDMAVNIFPQVQVGNFFNSSFINVAVQMNRTKKDDVNVKSWYKDDKRIADNYKIDAYPTYLFFNQNGILVHFIEGASSANDFIAKAKESFDPKTQYLNLKNEYKTGRRDSVFLLALVKAANKVNDDSLSVFTNDYLKTQVNLLTEQAINLIATGTKSTNDIGFTILLNNPKTVDSVIGSSERTKLLSKIAFNEQIYPLLSYNGEIKRTGGMIMYHEDSLKKNFDWSGIENEIDSIYKDAGKLIIVGAKLRYYEWLNDWADYNKCLTNYTLNENDIDLDFINTHAWNFTTYCDDKESLNNAVNWTSVLVKSEVYPYYFQTFSRLLYKAGEKEAALKYIEQCVSLLKTPDESVNEMVEKIKKGKKIE